MERPRIAAGQAMRGAVRAFFTYRGAFFWKMRAGMGDVVFAPFFEALKRRGVSSSSSTARPTWASRPRACSRRMSALTSRAWSSTFRPSPLTDNVPAAGGRREACRAGRRSRDWKQLVGGERLRREGWQFESHWDTRAKREGPPGWAQDFDLVVLAIGLGAIPHMCGESWRATNDGATWCARSSRLHAGLQLWMSDRIENSAGA